jgi:hypothetical protein
VIRGGRWEPQNPRLRKVALQMPAPLTQVVHVRVS